MAGRHRPWGVIADDLTGATDVAAAFANAGFVSIVILDPGRAGEIDGRVFVLSSNSRQSSVAVARRNVRLACRWLEQRGAEVIYKKMDSTLHGNILAEVRAIRAAAGFGSALICPANPAQGRVIASGHLIVHGVDRGDLRARLGVARDAASVAPPFQRQQLESLLRRTGLLLADATTERHLDKLVEAARRSPVKVLLAGSAGMAAALARRLAREHRTKPASRPRPTPRLGRAPLPFLIFSGSTSPVTRRQIEVLRQRSDAKVMDLSRSAGRRAGEALAAGRPVVVRVPTHRRPNYGIQRDLEQFSPLLRDPGIRLGGMLLVGGDTTLLICRWLRPVGIAIAGEIQPGLAWGRWLGGVAEGLRVGTKPGGFGTEDALAVSIQGG